MDEIANFVGETLIGTKICNYCGDCIESVEYFGEDYLDEDPGEYFHDECRDDFIDGLSDNDIEDEETYFIVDSLINSDLISDRDRKILKKKLTSSKLRPKLRKYSSN